MLKCVRMACVIGASVAVSVLGAGASASDQAPPGTDARPPANPVERCVLDIRQTTDGACNAMADITRGTVRRIAMLARGDGSDAAIRAAGRSGIQAIGATAMRAKSVVDGIARQCIGALGGDGAPPEAVRAINTARENAMNRLMQCTAQAARAIEEALMHALMPSDMPMV